MMILMRYRSGTEDLLDEEDFLEELFDTSEESMSTSETSSEDEEVYTMTTKILMKGLLTSMSTIKTIEKGKYCKGCCDRHHQEGIHQVIVGSERGSTFPSLKLKR